jgi:uncharacterized protein
MPAAQNKNIIEKVNAGFMENDPEVFLGYCADNVRWEMAGGKVQNGTGVIREYMASRADARLTKLNVTGIIAEGESAACYGDMNIDEEGTTTSYSYCGVYRFWDGKIVDMRSYLVKNKPEPEGELDRAASA